ncbi:MAG: NAD(P)/FAD-dependent oxidoreductase [Alphaproteobacteria bacterium]|jgi:thioredoxin reductase (NADPH)|nr:NAD(P)/FAD-dependent oxidoreductase [Alphaproteobacteria bacterium]
MPATPAFETDIVIIGAGPVGLFAVFEAGMLGLRCVVVDALDAPGGQCSALYPEKPIYDIPGFPQIEAQGLIDRLVEQAAPFHPDYRLGRQVVALTPVGDAGWSVATSAGDTILARAVIVAAGCGAFGPNRPPLAGIDAFEAGRTVHYYVRRREDYRGKRIVIAGGGDSAVDWALSLAEVAASVAVVHRRDRFRAAPESERRLKELVAAGRIDLVVPYQLDALEGQDGQLAAVIVRDLDGNDRRLDADMLLPFFGLAMTLGPIADFGLNLERNHIAVAPATMATSAPGVFAIGDIATYPGKLKLILTGFAEAAQAAHAIHPLVRPGQALHFEYSTTRGVPTA